MLVISRRPNERVRLTMPDGTHVWITVVQATN